MTDASEMISLEVDGVSYRIPRGSNLLAVCLDNGVYIPHLCFLENEDRPTASCRLCFVEIEEVAAPVPACTIKVDADHRVKTTTESVRRLQRSALRLLLSAHDVDCKNCHANRNCELQTLARFLETSLKPEPLRQMDRSKVVDSSHPFIDHYPHRCVLCGKCVRICRNGNGLPAFSFTGRGIDTVIRHYPHGCPVDLPCRDCLACIDSCPVGALKVREIGS